MSRSGRIGMGCYLFTDRNGAFNRTGIQATYAYHITMSTYQLSFGISLTGFQFKIDEDKIKTYDPGDKLLIETKKSALIPDANFGVYYTDRHIFAGISGMQLFQSTLKLSGSQGIGFKMIRHYYLMAGYRFDIIDFLFAEPSFLLKTTEKMVSQIDMTMKLYFKEDYWAGASYRTGGKKDIFEVFFRRKPAMILVALKNSPKSRTPWAATKANIPQREGVIRHSATSWRLDQST